MVDRQNKVEETKENSNSFEFTNETNPFRVRWNFTTMDWITMGFFSITLLPLRLFGLFITVILGWIISCIGLLGIDKSKPVTGYRLTLRHILFFLGRLCCRLAGFHTVTKTGVQVSKSVAPVMVAA